MLEGYELFEWYIEKKEGVSAWNKIYRKDLFEKIRYPEGRLHEDAFTTYKIFDKAKKIFYRNSILYKYRIRYGSIVHSSFSPKKMDNIYAQEMFFQFILNNYPKLRKKAKDKYIYSIVSLIDSYILYSESETDKIAEKYCDTIRKNYISILSNRMLTVKEKIFKMPTLFGYRFYCNFVKWYFK